MRNPLQNAVKTWEATRNGNIPIYKWVGMELHADSSGDVDFLIETANKFKEEGNNNKMSYVPYEHSFGYWLRHWMRRLVDKGFTMQILKEVRNELDGIRFFHVMMPALPTRGKPLPHWDFVADMADFKEPKTAAAYAFCQQLTLDGFSGLKCCQLKSCQRFFIGRPNTKWCSSACGSLYRVQQKRKRDKDRY